MKPIILFFLFVIHFHFVNSQSESIKFKNLDIEEGLSSSTVMCIEQDVDGFIWIGTNDGLNKYDGYNFDVFKHNSKDTLSICSSKIMDILNIGGEGLWVGTTKGISLYARETDSFLRYTPPSYKNNHRDFYVRSLTKASNGHIWIGCSYGLFEFDPSSRTFIKNGSSTGDPYAFTEKNVYKVVEDKGGILWLCTTEGLFTYSNGEVRRASYLSTHPIFRLNELFRDIHIDDYGNYWFATESLEVGIVQFDSSMNFIQNFSSSTSESAILAGNRIRVITELNNGNIWFGTHNGLSILDPQTMFIQNLRPNEFDQNSLSQKSVWDIFEDRDGGIWIATYYGGVNYYHPELQKFKHYKVEAWNDKSLGHKLVSSFTEDPKGNIWVGTENGLNYYNTANNTFTHYFRQENANSLLDNQIKTILLDNQDHLWIGSLQGLSIYSISDKKFQHFIYDPQDERSIGFGNVHVLCQDLDGHIWVGTNGGGLNRFDPVNNSFSRFSQVGSDGSESINLHLNAIVGDDESHLWIGTNRGIECFDLNKEWFVRSKLISDSVYQELSELQILSLLLDDGNNLWIGTHENGLYIYNIKSGRLINIREEDGLADNTVNGIQEDSQGAFWVSTNYGISKLTKPMGNWQDVSQAYITNFDVTDGLQGYKFYPNCSFKAKNGELYFGGTNGFNSFNPEEVSKSSYYPPVIIKDLNFRNDDSSIQWRKSVLGVESQNVEIAYTNADFTIEFAGLDYADPEHTLYSYKLEPIDQNWNEIGTQRAVFYSKLKPGEYIFKIRATNDRHSWGEDYNQIAFTILPPFWRTWWAYLIYLFTLIGLLYAFFTVAIKWGKLKSDLVWEHREREKEHELHQMRLKFFTDISHELRTPLTLILAPIERLINQFAGSIRSKNQLILIQRNGERMLQLINQLLDLRKLETGNLRLKAAEGDIVKFVNEVSLAFREIALQKNLTFNIQTSKEKISIWFDRDKMEVILYNLLSNAVKYTSEDGNIGLSLKSFSSTSDDFSPNEDLFNNGYVEIQVEDDGIGIPPEYLDKIFDRYYRYDSKSHGMIYGSGLGLEIVKKFVDLHKGTITVNSIESSAGQRGKTVFIIKLPVGRDHLEDADIVSDFRTSEDISLYKSISQRTEDDDIPVSQLTPEKNNESKSSLLVVEDNDEVRSFIVSLLEEEFIVHGASNGEDGLKVAFESIPDLIISDIMMPGIDGIELCRRSKSDPRTSHIPVILLTARTAVTFQIEGSETGADDYITKPFNSDLLRSRIKKIIEQRQKLKVRFTKGFSIIPENISVTSVDEKLMKKAIDYINDNISDPDLGVEKVATEVGLTRGHFYKKIKALTNLSAIEFINRIRLERSAQLLKTGKLNISEVRYEVGFNDADYFRQSFKKHFGVNPSRYVAGNNTPSA